MKTKNPEIEKILVKMMKNIKLKMKEKGFTQTSFSQALGVTPQTVSKWLSRKSSPKANQLIKVATLLNCKIESLIND